ncbi:alpha/beta hydrolase [Kribbella pittospori]|uniref:Alpha/beta hydrolase n=1 Tax=Kribbella pittospori TaxID=722689 RepID=A0A4R0KF48_9ACTN|nr:alpha/beta hydrolase [Kribbella pittospori]TCC57734.1 alpha/beta hydrolase [Kribbella pittospori]
MVTVFHRTATIQEHQVFYREAGPVDAPAIVLLHGYPASSYMFRNLIPKLADSYHVIAPDLLGFGLSDAPAVAEFPYTFDALADVVHGLLEQLDITQYAIYVQDYGAPTGWRLALRDPDAVTAIVTQSGNGYDEGFVEEFWAPIWEYNRDKTAENAAKLNPSDPVEAVKWQYVTGVDDSEVVDPEAWLHDAALLARPGNDEIQLAIIGDYASNPPMYAALHDLLRERQLPVLAVWGKGDPIFGPAGAEGFARDTELAEIHLLDGGHFLLESALDEVAGLMLDFLTRTIGR